MSSAAVPSGNASPTSPSQGSPGSPPSGIMGLLPKLESNLVQHMQMAQRDNANVHSFNLSLGTMTAPAPAPAPGPGSLSVSGDLGDVTTVQEGPHVKVDVSCLDICLCTDRKGIALSTFPEGYRRGLGHAIVCVARASPIDQECKRVG